MATTKRAKDAPGALAATVLEEEARRLARDETSPDATDEQELPGVGAAELSTVQVLRAGGLSTIAITFGLNLFDEFDRAAMSVLAPDIQRTLDISDTVLAALATIGGLLIVLGAIPIGYLADRVRRKWLIAGVSGVLGVGMLATGLVRDAWQLAATRLGAGFGKGGSPAYNSLLVDAYPIEGRARIFGLFNLANPIGLLLGPTMAGALAAAMGSEGWRWAFIMLSLPTLVLSALAAVLLREPKRGANEQQALFGDDEPLLSQEPPPLSAAFARLRKIKTFYYILIGVGVMGFGLFSFGIFFSLFLEKHWGLGPTDRGYVFSMAAVGGLAGAPIGGVIADRTFRRNPRTAMVASALLLVTFVLGPVSMLMPNLYLLAAVLAVSQFGLSAAFTGIIATVAAIIPFRLRGQGYAMVGLYLFFLGAFAGAIVTGQLSDAHGERTALLMAIPPPILLGAALMVYGSRFLAGDMAAAVAELQEEQDEHRRITDGGAIPALQVRNLDFSYDQVQVLFDVNVDVWPGEVLALLGTNGAGKSTLLRAISGLALPDRGVIRHEGRTITLADAPTRVRIGIVQVPGGKAVFPNLSVAENLAVGAHTFVWDRATVEARADDVFELFPILAERADQAAGSLSGGEQQMLGIAKGLMLQPKLLLIDELSLGLAPVVVQQLLSVVESLKARGITMVIVEQSVNVALAIADRAVFMEKGRVRFEGKAKDLLERDDLVRAVFLGGEGG